MNREIVERLRYLGILPSAQRVAVAKFVLQTTRHPCAEEVLAAVREEVPMISLATVYNTLHLFAEKGLLRELALSEGKVVFDPRMDPHHHLIDEDTGAILDLDWSALRVEHAAEAARAQGFEVSEYQVVLRGRRAARRPARSTAAPKGKRRAR